MKTYNHYTLDKAIRNRMERIETLPPKEKEELIARTIKQFKRMISGPGTTLGPEIVNLSWDEWGYIRGMSIGNRLDMQDHIHALQGKVSPRQEAASLIDTIAMRQLGLIAS